jgi:hypothetical protein
MAECETGACARKEGMLGAYLNVKDNQMRFRSFNLSFHGFNV